MTIGFLRAGDLAVKILVFVIRSHVTDLGEICEL